MDAPKKTWRESGGGIAFKEHMNGLDDGEEEGEAKPGDKDVESGMCGDGDWVGNVVVVVVG